MNRLTLSAPWKASRERRLRILAICQLRQEEGLITECVRRDLCLDGKPAPGGVDEEKSSWLTRRLLEQERLDCWKEQGFPVDRLYDYKSAAEMVARFLATRA